MVDSTDLSTAIDILDRKIAKLNIDIIKNKTEELESELNKYLKIKHELMRVKTECVNLGLLKDIVYDVEKKDARTVDIHIQKLLFDGVITEIDVYVTVEVE